MNDKIMQIYAQKMGEQYNEKGYWSFVYDCMTYSGPLSVDDQISIYNYYIKRDYNLLTENAKRVLLVCANDAVGRD